jgi:SOS-response transcriptional repressor LexA
LVLGISDDDLVVVRKQTAAENSEIKAAVVTDSSEAEDGGTFQCADGNVWLKPQSPRCATSG